MRSDFSLLAASLLAGCMVRFLWDRIQKWDLWEAVVVRGYWPGCEHCGEFWGLKLEDSRTLYHFEGDWDDPQNPNRSVLLCRRCAVQHHEHWDEMWREYYSGRL